MEAITLSTPKKVSNEAQAEVVRSSAGTQLGKALALAIGGTVLGAMSILIPVAHFVTTWAIPLVSIFAAWHIYKMGPHIQRIVGTCPSCEGAIDSEGGTAAPDLWIRCPHCNEALHPSLHETS